MILKQIPFENIEPNPWQTRLVEDPQLRSTMGQAGLAFCRHSGHFSLDAMVQRTESAYIRWLGELKK